MKRRFDFPRMDGRGFKIGDLPPSPPELTPKQLQKIDAAAERLGFVSREPRKVSNGGTPEGKAEDD